MAKRHYSKSWVSDAPGKHGCTPDGVTFTKAGNASGRADYRMPDLYDLVEDQMKKDGSELMKQTSPAKW